MGKKLNYDFIKNEFLKRGFILLSKKYEKNCEKLDIEDLNGYKTQISYSNFQQGKTPSMFSIFNEFTIENIKHFIKENDEETTLISTCFLGDEKPLELECKCGEIFYSSWAKIRDNKYIRCPKCVSKTRGLSKRISYEKIKEL